jgi:hypothetical protein
VLLQRLLLDLHGQDLDKLVLVLGLGLDVSTPRHLGPL